MKTPLTLLLAIIATTAFCQEASSKKASHPPNIIVLYADDLGYADAGFQGSKEIKTPNLDALAAGGIRCTDAYMSAPQCSPSRAALLTGRYQQRFGYEHIAPAGSDGGLPEDEVIIPVYLKKAGYHTGIIGKWHLGELDSQSPESRGFDEFYGFRSGGHHYYPELTKENVSVHSAAAMLYENGKPVNFQGYLTDALAEKSAEFIARNKERPFFLYVPFNAPHTPLEEPERYKGKFPVEGNPRRSTYLAMIAALDDAVGRIVEAVKENGLENDTLIIFTNDNGGVTLKDGKVSEASNAPLSGAKGLLQEGGIRVPWIWYWPGTLKPGVYQEPICGIDLLPTLLDVAGLKAPEGLDGVDLWPSLAHGEQLNRGDNLYWRFKFRGRLQGAARQGDWKYYKVEPTGEPTPYGNIPTSERLYNLRDDIAEKKNLASANPEKLKELREAWEKWNSQLKEPAWPSDINPKY